MLFDIFYPLFNAQQTISKSVCGKEMNQCARTQPNLLKLILKVELTLQEEKKVLQITFPPGLWLPCTLLFCQETGTYQIWAFSQRSSPHHFHSLLLVLLFFACFLTLCINITNFIHSFFSSFILSFNDMLLSFLHSGSMVSRSKAPKQTRQHFQVTNYLKIVEKICGTNKNIYKKKNTLENNFRLYI